MFEATDEEESRDSWGYLSYINQYYCILEVQKKYIHYLYKVQEIQKL